MCEWSGLRIFVYVLRFDLVVLATEPAIFNLSFFGPICYAVLA